MPPSSKAYDAETLRSFMRPFTPLPPVDWVSPLYFAAPHPLVEKSPVRSFLPERWTH